MKSQESLPDFLQTIHDPLSRSVELQDILGRGNGDYYLCLGGTQTSDIEGISAAGATPQERRLTPSIDGDILVHGRPRDNENVPVSPTGIVSPVVIVRACLDLMQWRSFVVDCGTFRSPLSPHMVAGNEPALCLSSGASLSENSAASLFARGLKQGREAAFKEYLLIGECVPGGTTTAAALFQAFGIDGASYASSSVHMPDKLLRQRLIHSGLQKAGLSKQIAIQKPLAAVSAVGDPMQPFVAGLALGAAARVPVILAGGSQMLAVFYLAKLLAAAHNLSTQLADIFIVTTKWVAFDQVSNTRLLSEIAGAQYFAACPDFTVSVHAGLRAYEEGNVKEGLGAGALMAAAQAATGVDNATLVAAIDKVYSEVVLRKNLIPTCEN
jgi:uncharacterized protein (TIGR00303 family)